MGRRTSTPQETPERDQPTDPGPGPQPHPRSETPTRTTLSVGPLLVRTIRHFFPQLNDWIDRIDDPRFLPFVVYDKRFLLWWGLALFLFKLGSRRQLDFQLDARDTEVLENLNRLAGTRQTTRPVHNTLDYFLGGIGVAAVADLRTQMMRRLIRNKTLDGARLQGRLVVPVDGTGYLVFRTRHCPHCLTRRCGETTLYMHQVLEAKVLGPADTVFSLASTFIDNRDAAATADAEQFKQDCELKALRRLACALRGDFPQLRLCLSGDGLFACGEGFQIAKDYRLDYVYVFKPGRLPTLWEDFQGLLRLCPAQRVELRTPAKIRQVYRWVNDLTYTDTHERTWTLNALECRETHPDGSEHLWAWLTPLPVNRHTVVAIANQAGRPRWCIENQGFNTQKNSGLNLEHAYSHEAWASYYYLLQIAHMLLQLLEKGSLLRQLAAQQGSRTALAWLGSLKNLAARLLDSVRYARWPTECYDAQAAKIQIRLDSG